MSTSEHVYDAIILGAGYGGLGAGAELVRSGLADFLILERSAEIGGVWRDNVYPGAACDTQSVIYCYSYFLHLSVTRMYAGQAELLGYLTALAAEYGLGEKLRLDTEVLAARWDDERALWVLATSAGEYLARVFIPAWGQLGTPSIPEIPGAETFTGRTFHSVRWDHDLDLAGLRVASIGNAASAVQYVPEVAKVAEQVVVFQRSANYILPRNQIVFTAQQSREFLDEPDSYRAIRADIHHQREVGLARTRHDTSAQASGVAEALAHLEAQVPDPELRVLLTPHYEFGCKRVLRSDDFYPAMSRPNVTLETDPIDRITATGIRTRSGVEHPVDVIVYGTGFRSQAFQDQTEVVGRDGLTLSDRWRDEPEAYLGMTVDGFPNLFAVYGPNTNLNHNSVVTMLEAQHRYIAQAVRQIRDAPDHPLEVRPEVLREFNEWMQAELQKSAYSSDCSSWYKNAAGKVINNWCGTADEYGEATRVLVDADYLTS